MTHAPKPPATAAEIPPEWTDMIREIVQRDGAAIRAAGTSPVIEVKSLRTNQWLPLMLPGGGLAFTNYDERNLVLRRIQA